MCMLGAQPIPPVTWASRLVGNSHHDNFPGELANYNVVRKTTKYQSLGTFGPCITRHGRERDDVILKKVERYVNYLVKFCTQSRALLLVPRCSFYRLLSSLFQNPYTKH